MSLRSGLAKSEMAGFFNIPLLKVSESESVNCQHFCQRSLFFLFRQFRLFVFSCLLMIVIVKGII